MSRPLPHIPRGPRRRASTRSKQHWLACPRFSPEWELSALRALMKPQLKDAIAHRSAEQRWPADATQIVEDVTALVRQCTGFDARVELPAEGEFLLVLPVPDEFVMPARALAMLLSRRMPELWFVMDRL